MLIFLRFVALLALLGLLSCSGYALSASFTVLPVTEGSGTGLLIILHLVAAALLTGCFLLSNEK